MAITKGEREELRRIVRGDFRALGSELKVRYAELLAEIELRVATRFHAHEDALTEAELEANTIVNEANARLSGAFQKAQDAADGYEVRWMPLNPPRVQWVRQKRDEMRRAMIADLDARVEAAKASMQRQEIELLKNLSVDALESAEATAFLSTIPTVAALVPTSRLAELEAQFNDDDEGEMTV